MPIEIKTLGTRELWDAFSQNPIDTYKDVAQRMVQQVSARVVPLREFASIHIDLGRDRC